MRCTVTEACLGPQSQLSKAWELVGLVTATAWAAQSRADPPPLPCSKPPAGVVPRF